MKTGGNYPLPTNERNREWGLDGIRIASCLRNLSSTRCAQKESQPPIKFFSLIVATLVFFLTAGVSMAGDPSSFISGVADAPPEDQVRMLRIILDDVFGTPEELKEQFVQACKARKVRSTTPPAPAAPTDSQAESSSRSKEAVLFALCAGPVRTRIEAALTPRHTSAASEPVPSIEKKAPGKPETASDVER